MKIEKNMVVGLIYDLASDEGKIESVTEESPLEYIQGMHMLIPKFEKEVEGLDEGDSFTFSVSPQEGYGEYDAKRRFDIPKTSFMVDGQLREDLLEIGRIVPMIGSSGNVINATIAEVKENDVTVDFNHPMAGKTLHFSGRIVSVRKATEKELLEGLHGEFLPQDDCCCGWHGHGHGHGECCHGHHKDGECCHEDGQCCHEDGECCHEDGECCHGHHEDGGCCHGHE